MLIAGIVSSILLYAAPVWGTTLQITFNAIKLSAAYRRTTLRVCSAFRTVSDDAAFVIFGMMRIENLADELTNK